MLSNDKGEHEVISTNKLNDDKIGLNGKIKTVAKY